MKVKPIEWTDFAIKDLDIIFEYISKDSVKNANDFIDKLIQNVEELKQFSNRGRVIPQINRDYYREIFIGNYRVMYKIDKDIIYIMAVINSL